MKTLSMLLMIVLMLGMASSLHAGPISSCAADFSSCDIYEDGQTLFFPGLAISGDVVLTESWASNQVSDVFRIFNDFFDTGGGTGLGISAFLYSADDGNLPDPSTYSANAISISETAPPPGGGLTETDYVGNGTTYRIFSQDTPVPEPSTLLLLGMGGVALAGLKRSRLTSGRP